MLQCFHVELCCKYIYTYKCLTFTAYELERQRVLPRIPRGNYIHVTAEDGKRVYMSLKDEMTLNKQVCPLIVCLCNPLHNLE